VRKAGAGVSNWPGREGGLGWCFTNHNGTEWKKKKRRRRGIRKFRTKSWAIRQAGLLKSDGGKLYKKRKGAGRKPRTNGFYVTADVGRT